MNIMKESLEMEIAQYQRIIDSYLINPEYVNPNCSIDRAKLMIEMLTREYFINPKIV